MIEVDVWVRGTEHATTHQIESVPLDTTAWTDTEVRDLLVGMLRALERQKNPGGEPPSISLRGFSWIVSPDDAGGVLLHLEMQMGSASAGPFAIDEARLTSSIGRVLERPPAADRVH
jgi:hypothetical protein